MTNEPETAWLGHATPTTASVVVHTNTDGDVTVECNGVTHGPVASDQATNFGCVRVELAGLTENTRYGQCAVKRDGAIIATVYPSTMPSSGKWSILWGSCIQSFANRLFADAMPQLIDRFNIRATFLLGDVPYCDDTRSLYRTTSQPIGWVSTAGNAIDSDVGWLHSLNFHLYMDPGWCSRIPCYFMHDDHDIGTDNWDHTLAQANESYTWAVDQDDVDAHWAAAEPVLDAALLGNPIYSHPLRVAQAPGHVNAADAAYPPRYFVMNHGGFDFWVLDFISHRGPFTGTPDSNILGTDQEAWFQVTLAASTSPVKSVMATKKTYQHVTDNPDGWDGAGYEAARDVTMAAIETASGWNRPGGVWFGTGDRHEIEVLARTTATNGNDHLAVNPCPTGLQYPLAQSPGTAGASTRLLTPMTELENAVGITEFNSDTGTAEVFMYSLRRGRFWGPALLSDGNNGLVYPARTKVA